MTEADPKTIPPGGPKMPPVAADQPIDDVPLFKRKRVVLPLLITVAAILGGGWYWYTHSIVFIGTDDAFVDANRLTVSARIMGRITGLRFDEGDTVRQGDTLVKLDHADLLAQLARADASLRYLTRSAEIQKVNLEKVLDDFSRAERQFKAQVATEEQYNHAGNAVKLTQAQADMAQAQIATAQADIAVIKTQLGNTVITAPFSGTVARRWVMEGDVVQPAQSILTIYDTKNVWITANYEETKLRFIKPDMRAEIFIDALPGTVLTGKVLWIGQSTASQFSLIPGGNASGNFTKVTQRVPVRIAPEMPNSGMPLLPGLSATVHILVK